MIMPDTRYLLKTPALTPVGTNRDLWTAEGGYVVRYLKGGPGERAYEISHASGKHRCASLGAVLDAIEEHIASGKWA